MASASDARENIEPVLIVGGGPVGLALAGDLGWRGVRCTLIEQTDGSIYQPRMDLVGIRTMEFCRRWGLVGAVEGSPYPRDYAQDNIYLTSLTGYELGRERFPGSGQAPPPPQSPPPGRESDFRAPQLWLSGTRRTCRGGRQPRRQPVPGSPVPRGFRR